MTTYNHMSGFGRGIAEGRAVIQGQTVGYLGQTGLATGPHLHYEVIINGNFVDPMAIKLARTREFDGRMLATSSASAIGSISSIAGAVRGGGGDRRSRPRASLATRTSTEGDGEAPAAPSPAKPSAASNVARRVKPSHRRSASDAGLTALRQFVAGGSSTRRWWR